MNEKIKGWPVAQTTDQPAVKNSGESITNSIVSIPSNDINEKIILVFETLASLGRIMRGQS
jgi:hypothetical protein